MVVGDRRSAGGVGQTCAALGLPRSGWDLLARLLIKSRFSPAGRPHQHGATHHSESHTAGHGVTGSAPCCWGNPMITGVIGPAALHRHRQGAPRTSGDCFRLALQDVGHPANSAPKALDSWGPRVGRAVSLVRVPPQPDWRTCGRWPTGCSPRPSGSAASAAWAWPSIATATSAANPSSSSASATPPWRTSAIRPGSGMNRQCRTPTSGWRACRSTPCWLSSPSRNCSPPARRQRFPAARTSGSIAPPVLQQRAHCRQQHQRLAPTPLASGPVHAVVQAEELGSPGRKRFVLSICCYFPNYAAWLPAVIQEFLLNQLGKELVAGSSSGRDPLHRCDGSELYPP